MVDVGGSSSLTVHDLETGQVEQHAIHGEPKDMTPVGDSIYTANYPSGTLWKFDPKVGEPERIGGWDIRQTLVTEVVVDGLDGISHRALAADEHGDLYLVVGTNLVRLHERRPGRVG